MWRSQKDDSAEMGGPLVASCGAIAMGTSGDQASHAVADDRQFFQGHRPLLY